MNELTIAGYECLDSIKISLEIIAGQYIIINLLLGILIILISLKNK